MKVTLFKGGTRECEVDLRTYEIDGEAMEWAALLMKKKPFADATMGLLFALTEILRRVRTGQPLPPMCFWPDLWVCYHHLPHEEFQAMWQQVAAAHCILDALYANYEPCDNNHGVAGNWYRNPRKLI